MRTIKYNKNINLCITQLFCAILFLILFSCQDKEADLLTEEISLPTNSLIISQEEAERIALSFYNDCDGCKFINKVGRARNSVRDKHPVKINSVYPWRKVHCFSSSRLYLAENLPDTMLYVINFDNNKGSVLVSADRRVEEIIAYIDNGTLTPWSKTDNPGFNYFLESLWDYYEQRMDEFPEFPHDSLPSLPTDPDTLIFDYGNIAPLLTTTWGQRSPYNRFCFTDNGQQAVTGCVATAAAQVIAYHQYPASYNGHVYLWDEIMAAPTPQSEDAMNSVSYLMADIGRLVHMSYGQNSSGAVSSNVGECLDSLGFAHSSYSAYNYGICMSNFAAGKPVFIRGRNASTGHAWVVDGGMTRFLTVGASPDGSSYQNLIHCNWGWNGSQNGYFLSSVFNTSNPVPVPISRRIKHSDYSQYVMIYYNISPL